jgi:hypothetical protein
LQENGLKNFTRVNVKFFFVQPKGLSAYEKPSVKKIDPGFEEQQREKQEEKERGHREQPRRADIKRFALALTSTQEKSRKKTLYATRPGFFPPKPSTSRTALEHWWKPFQFGFLALLMPDRCLTASPLNQSATA